MEIHLIRHIAPAVVKGICYGQTELELPANYTELHQHIIDTMPGPYDRVYSSPLKRCRLLAEALEQPIHYDDRLMEVNFGEWENRLWNDLDQEELNRWMYNYITQAPPGGESLTQLVSRFQQFVQELPPADKILIITHAGIIRAAYHLFNQQPLDKIMMAEAEYGKVYRFSL